MSLIEKSVKHLSSQVDKISSSLDQVLEYSYSYNIKLVGVPELKQHGSLAALTRSHLIGDHPNP